MAASDAPNAGDVGDEEQTPTKKRPAASRPIPAPVVEPADAPGGALSGRRAWLARLLDRYPPLEPPLEGLGARVGFWFVVACAAAYAVLVAAFLFAQQDAWQTHAEDMGIMTQALWNTTHGALLHQTICNNISDTNCIGDVSRFAIHFEPIMLPIALLYAIIPSAKTLQLLQVAIVASGALPAYWLASRKLRSSLAGVAFALLYLIYPSLQAAVTYDFHAVTLAAAFLMFALYFMLSRNDLGLFIACLLALATKEEIPVDVVMIAASIALFQRRWRTGGALAGLAVVWLVGELLIMRAVSPLGHSPTASRYAQFGATPLAVALTLLTHPVMVLRQYVFSAGGIYYLRTLLSGTGYLAALSPWALAIAGPALAINLLSSYPAMHSGLYQYDSEIVPVMVFAAIDAVWWLSRASDWLAPRLGRLAATAGAALGTWGARAARWPWPRLVIAGLTLFAFTFGGYGARAHGRTPLTPGITWPLVTAHAQQASQVIALIPPNASVSAQSDLVPHVSNRRYIYLYPFNMDSAEYVFLDVTGSIYPQSDRDAYARQVQALLRDPGHHVVAARDGYLLLARGAGPALDPTGPFGLPPSFFTFATHPGTPSHALSASFGPSLQLVGYDIAPAATIYPLNPFLRVVTYWRVSASLTSSLFPEVSMSAPGGVSIAASASATTEWLPVTSWRPGAVYAVDSGPIYVASASAGANQVSLRVLTGAAPDPLAQPLVCASAQGQVVDGGTRLVIATEDVR